MKPYMPLVEECEFTVRAYNVLKNANVVSIAELANWSRRDLFDRKNCGKITVAEIERVIAEHGIALRVDA